MTDLTPRIVAYCCSQEGIVPEAYLDVATPPVWTWAAGITAAAGVDVLAYKDKPAPLEACLRATIACMRRNYLPAVRRAIPGELSEIQLAAALSFHWHYGAIATAQWVKHWNAARREMARTSFLSWTDFGKAEARAKVEQAMFFDGIWPENLKVPVYSVAKPRYRPVKPVSTDILPLLPALLEAA